MSNQMTSTTYATLQDWIAHEAIPFNFASESGFKSAFDQLLSSIDPAVRLLGIGETLHGGEEFMLLRNRLFQHLVEAHGYTAIAIESSFPKSRLMNDYVLGRGADSYDQVKDLGISHGFGSITANRELVEWMRHYNANPAHQTKIHFYGFDSPTEMYGTDSPRQLLTFALDYFTSVDPTVGQRHRQRIESLIGDDAAWENPEVAMNPTLGIGLSPTAAQLRIATEDLIADLTIYRPAWIAKSDKPRFQSALHYATMARQLLNYHAELAGQADDRFIRLLGIRDTIMADALLHIMEQESGKVLAFAHNSHLKRGKAEWQLGEDHHVWWPAGAHLDALLGDQYVMIGTALGISEANGVAQPESGTLEAALTAIGTDSLIPTHRGQMLPPSLIADLPIRSGSQRNRSYFELTHQSFTDYDWICTLGSTGLMRSESPSPFLS